MSYKLFFLTLSILGVGIPFNTPWHYGYAFLITFFLVFGQKRPTLQLKWIVLGVGFFGAAQILPQLNILEQQRLLVENNTVISPQQFMEKPTNYPFAQTADGFVQGLGLTRLVPDIKLTNDLKDLRSGYVNKPQFNFYNSPLVRKALPFVVSYKITESLLQRGFTGQGLFYYDNHFVIHTSPTLISFKADLRGTFFYAFGADRRSPATEKNPYLSLQLNKTWQDSLITTLLTVIKLLGISLLAYGFFALSQKTLETSAKGLSAAVLDEKTVKQDRGNVSVPLVRASRENRVFAFLSPKESFAEVSIDWRELLLLSAWTGLFLLQHGDIIGREVFARAGSDGIIHGGYPYIMLEDLAAGNWLKALESPESIFYFMPGMRYVRFIEMLIFGDSYPLQVTLLLFTPVIYYRFFKALLAPIGTSTKESSARVAKTALILSSLMFIKALNFLGLSYKLHLVRFLKLYGENVSYACLMGALVLLIKKISSRWQGFWAFFLLAIATSIRPNLLIFVACLAVAYFFSSAFSRTNKKDKFIHLLGLSPLSLIPLHNIIFGNKWVLLTKASQISENLPLPPHFYIEGLQCLLGLSSSCTVKEAFMKHFLGYGSLVVFFMAINLTIFLRQKQWNKIKALAMATFFGLSVHLFYLANDRYLHPYLTISVVMSLLLVRGRKKLF